MSILSQDELQNRIYRIHDRVKTYGRDSEVVKIHLDITLNGQEAINYQVLRLFAHELTDVQFINLMYLLGQKNGVEILKFLAPAKGVQI